MGNANEAPAPGSVSGARQGFTDSLGDRVITAGAGQNELVEILHLRRDLTAVSSFEFALRERAARLANFQHTAFARVRQIDRQPPPESSLAIVSDHVPGWRLAEILSAVQEQHLELDINAALCLIKQFVHGLAILHQHARGVAHGALGPERVVVTAHARLVIVEYVLGSALERLEMTRERLWRELRIAVPPSAGSPRFDPRTDVTQLGTIAMALVLGCPLAGDDYPEHMADLIAMATENRTLGGRRPLSKSLRTWLARALQLDLRHSFQSAIDAESELEALLLAEPGYVAAPVALETFLAAYRRSAAASPRTISEHREEPPEEAPEEGEDADEAEELTIVIPSEEPDQHVGAAIELDNVIADLDHLLDESGLAKSTAPIAESAPLTGSAASTTSTTSTTAPVDHAPAPPVRHGSEPVDRVPVAPSRSAADLSDRAPVGLPGPTVEPAHRAAVAPLKPMTEPAGRAPVAPPRPAAQPAGRAASPPARSIVPEPDRGPKKQEPDRAPKKQEDLDRGYPGSFESLFGNQAAAATADREKRDEDDDRTAAEGKEAGAGRMRRIVLGLAALLVLAAGGYLGFRYLLPYSAQATSGTLLIESQPAGLSVKIDGSPRGTTPVKATLPAGQHQLEIEVGGQPRVIPITITAGGQVSQYIEAPAAPATGRLQVTSEPAGAAVLVDGERKGTAPLLVSDLAVGRHRVELQADGTTRQQEVTIEPGGTSSLVVPMSSASDGPVSGWLAVTSPVELQVFEGTELVGTSQSGRILMTAGRHDLDIVNDTLGYRERQTVQVAPGKVNPIKVQLPKGSLSLNAIPWADVFVDGEPAGQTPIGNLSLTIGPHEIVFRHPQLGEQRHAVTVTMKAPARVSADLRK